MTTKDTTADRSPPALVNLLAWLDGQLTLSRRALLARQQAATTWAIGSAEDWRNVGCHLTKAQRIEEAEKEKRIARQHQRDVEMIEALIVLVRDQAVIATQ